MADVQRTGGIGADELDHRARALAGIAAAEPFPLAPDRLQLALPDLTRQPDVEETGAGDLDPLDDPLRVLDAIDDLLRQLARIRFRNLLQDQRGVGGEVPVLGLPGRLELELARFGQPQPADGRAEDRAELLLHHAATLLNSFSKSGRRRSQLVCKCSIITLVSPSTGMKLVSPFQRGTTCQWR